MQWRTYGQSMTGSSDVNGDQFWIASDGLTWMLADGASGAGRDGKVLMGRTCQEMLMNNPFDGEKESPHHYMDRMFRIINQRLIQLSQFYGCRVFGTLDIALFHEGILYGASVGDSPIWLMQGGNIRTFAASRNWAQQMIEQGHLQREDYQQALDQMPPVMRGCFDQFIPDVVPQYLIDTTPLQAGDRLVMCCDGISDWISPEETFATLESQGLEKGVNQLIQWAHDRAIRAQQYHDDITLICGQWG